MAASFSDTGVAWRSRLVEKPRCQQERLLGGHGGEGRAERHRQRCQPRPAGLVPPDCSPLPSRPRAPLRCCPHGCPHGNSRVTAISPRHLCLPSTCPHEGASAQGQSWPTSCVRVPLPRPVLQTSLPQQQQQQQPSLVTQRTGRCGPWAAWRSATMEDTPPCAPNLPFPEGGDLRCHREKMCPGAVKINDHIFCKIPSKCNKVY